MSLPGSFSLGWLWDSVVLQSAELGVLQVQHGAHYRKSDARSEDSERSQREHHHPTAQNHFQTGIVLQHSPYRPRDGLVMFLMQLFLLPS